MFLFKKYINSLSKLLMVSLCFITFCMNNAIAESNVAAIEAAVAAFKTIGTLRKEFPINGEAVATAHAGALQTLTQEIDTVNFLTLDSDVLAAIDDIKNDHEPLLAA